jgi:hypothetical protein
MQVTHTDGYPVVSADTDALLLGMGERYDVLVTLDDGVFPLFALAEGKNATALGQIRTGTGATPPVSIRPSELDRRIVAYRQLHPADPARLPARKPHHAAAEADRDDDGLRLALRRARLRPKAGRPRRHRRAAGADGVRQRHHHVAPRCTCTGTTSPPEATPAHLKTPRWCFPGQTLRVEFDADNHGL